MIKCTESLLCKTSRRYNSQYSFFLRNAVMWSKRSGNYVAIALDPRSSCPGSGLLETLRSVFNKDYST